LKNNDIYSRLINTQKKEDEYEQEFAGFLAQQQF
jgi:hypothetical protein